MIRLSYHIPASRIKTRLLFTMTLCQKKNIQAVYNSNKAGLEIGYYLCQMQSDYFWSWFEVNFLLHIAGWEYGVNPTYGVYGPVMKAYHMCRRRRLVRSRELVDAKATKKQVKTSRVKK